MGHSRRECKSEVRANQDWQICARTHTLLQKKTIFCVAFYKTHLTNAQIRISSYYKKNILVVYFDYIYVNPGANESERFSQGCIFVVQTKGDSV
jgi:hypothetical protein